MQTSIVRIPGKRLGMVQTPVIPEEFGEHMRMSKTKQTLLWTLPDRTEGQFGILSTKFTGEQLYIPRIPHITT